MKKLFLTLSTIAIAMSSAFSQNINGASAANMKNNVDAVKAKIEKNNTDIENPKNAAKVAAWESRGKLFMEAASVNTKGISAGMQAAKSSNIMDVNNLEVLVGAPAEKKQSDQYEIWVYPTINIYVQNNQVQFWEETYPADKDALGNAVKSYRKACELDTKGSFKSKKTTVEAIRNIRLAYTNNGINKYFLGKYNEAATDFESALALSDFPKAANDTAKIEGMIAFYGGLSSFQAGDKSKAEKMFNESINLNYEIGKCYHYIFQIRMDEGKSDEALKIIQNAYEKYPQEESLLYDVINYYTSQKEFDKAETYLNKAIEKYPDNLSVFGVKGSIYVENYTKLKDNYLATRNQADSLKKLAFKNRNNKSENDRLTAEENAKKQEAAEIKEQYNVFMSKADQTYNDILAKDPKYFDAYFSLGIVYYDKSDMAGQEANLIPFSEDKDGSKAAVKIAEQKEAFKKSAEYFEKALEIQPNNVNVLTNLRMLYTKLGEYDKSKAMKQRLEELGQ
ncbi:MAG: tetratricopeptide repeat protein [Bacteroidales bacterium]|nr:tetratricopeptide repeat protein [Bacteroidales bacterium]